MKKLFAAVLAMTVSASVFAAEPVKKLVYDYRASFKRIDAQYKVRTVKIEDQRIPLVTDVYTVKSDSLKGYVILPKCNSCLTDNVLANELYDGTGIAYLTRRGGKYGRPVYKVKADANVSIFGAYVQHDSGDGDEHTLSIPRRGIEDAKKAWMYLTFEFSGPDATYTKLNPSVVIKKLSDGGNEKFTYGFYGLDNDDVNMIYNAGFGVVRIEKGATKGTKPGLGICGPSEGIDPKTWSCQIVTSINGSMVGDANYKGTCGMTPMWDLCYADDIYDESGRDVIADNKAVRAAKPDAGVAGTWSLRFNKTLSAVADDAKDAEILNKFGKDIVPINCAE